MECYDSSIIEIATVPMTGTVAIIVLRSKATTIFTNHRTNPSQITEQNSLKSPNKSSTNNRKVCIFFG